VEVFPDLMAPIFHVSQDPVFANYVRGTIAPFWLYCSWGFVQNNNMASHLSMTSVSPGQRFFQKKYFICYNYPLCSFKTQIKMINPAQCLVWILRFTPLLLWITTGCHTREKATTVRPPNILICIADDISYPHMGAYGTRWVSTPGFDRVAREGLLFHRMYTPNAKCAPSRACLLTGRNSWQLEEAANHIPYFPEKFKTYPEALGENGYFVGYTAKGWAPGVAIRADGTKRQLTGKAYSELKTEVPAKGISTIDYAGNFGTFLQDRPKDQPFCFWYGSLEPHRDYEFATGVNLGGKQLTDIDRVPAYWPDNDTVRHDLLDYAFEIEYFDLHLQRMLALLEEQGELDNTIVIVTADHGMPFPRVKGQAYEASNHIPFAVMWRNGLVQAGRDVFELMSLIDVAPTLLALAGVDAGAAGMQPMQGRDFTELLLKGQWGRQQDYVLIGKERHDVGRPDDQGYPIRGLVTEKWLYIENFETSRWPAGNPETGYLNTDAGPTKTWILQHRRANGNSAFWDRNFGKRPERELYDLANDPDCLRNLVANPQHAETADVLQQRMYLALQEQQDPRMFGQGQLFDAYPYANEGQRLFYNRYMAGEKLPANWVLESDFETGPIP
jgi:arylsulfatase A-like enzyme